MDRRAVYICLAAVTTMLVTAMLSRRDCFCESLQWQEKKKKLRLSRCKFPLVVHVGPHKTGTTSFQKFLCDHAQWLQKEHGIFVAANKTRKEAAYIASTISKQYGRPYNPKYANSTRMAELFQVIDSMPKNSPVILSSEEFSRWKTAEWNYFKSQPAIQKRCLSMVVTHRQVWSFQASVWNQHNKLNKQAMPQPFLITVLKDKNHFTDFQLKLLDVLDSASDSVDVVSYEYLHERNYSLASFVVCNATRRLEGTEWESCKMGVDLHVPLVINPSEPPTAFDVVRLAYGLYTKQKALNSTCRLSQFTLATYHNSAVSRVAEQMPTQCENLPDEYVDELYYNRTGVLRPSGNASTICFVDEGSLKLKHWKLLSTLLPQGCQITTG
ncbi:Uncharacterized protein SCF082_LOCUS615 [Durusdinium trenchii]|uniref:Sulfotransferase n=1 Tax=Durusdinium trenchii TaxID=1381693 RepID=A0ABP0H8P6_9DINO